MTDGAFSPDDASISDFKPQPDPGRPPTQLAIRGAPETVNSASKEETDGKAGAADEGESPPEHTPNHGRDSPHLQSPAGILATARASPRYSEWDSLKQLRMELLASAGATGESSARPTRPLSRSAGETGTIR